MHAVIPRLAALSLLVSTTVPSPAEPARGLPERFEATFLLEVSGATIARSRWSLSPGTSGRYLTVSRTEPVGMFALLSRDTIVERSEWSYADDWLQPHTYHYERTGRKPRKVDITFDWEKGIAFHDSPTAPWRLRVAHGTMDKFNYLFALMRDLGRGKRDVEYAIADGGRLKRYVLKSIGEERIDTALGRFDTAIVRRERANSKRETTLWLARALGFFPVKIVHVERDGKTMTIRIESLSGITPRGS